MEFKKLSAVDTVNSPSEDANVLIEEDGIIKKVHASSLIPVVESDPYAAYDCVAVARNDFTIAKLVKGDYESLYNKFLNGEIINVLVVMYYYENYDGEGQPVGSAFTMKNIINGYHRVETNQDKWLYIVDEHEYYYIGFGPNGEVEVGLFD